VTISMFTPPGEAFDDVLSEVGLDLGTRGLIDPANVSTRPRPGVKSAEELVGIFTKWFGERRAQQGGAAADEAFAPGDATYAERRFQAIERFEGTRSRVYKDVVGIRTVGVGFNMDQPAARQMWAAAGLAPEKFDAVREGRAEMGPQEIRRLADSTIQGAQNLVDERFKGVDLSEGQRIALVSLAFNAPALIGPRLVSAVREGRTADAVQEILYHSGTARIPQLAGRRYHEAQMFVGALDAPAALPAYAAYKARPTAQA
jgi:GH24 family phage-related lysozyme (muramidase)